jgi:hypothetical protein
MWKEDAMSGPDDQPRSSRLLEHLLRGGLVAAFLIYLVGRFILFPWYQHGTCLPVVSSCVLGALSFVCPSRLLQVVLFGLVSLLP